VFIWPTPNHEDYLFWVEKNGDLPKNQSFSYGTRFPDEVKYPDHKLVFVSPQTPDAWSRWFYASDRINQDAYNWEFAQADIGGVKFDAVKRTYLTLRSAFNPEVPAMGTTMVNVPVGKFTGTYVLAERQQQRIGQQELDSLYVQEVRTYVTKVAISDISTDPMLGIGQQKTTDLYYRGELVNETQTIETVAADPSDPFWGLQDDGTDRSVQQISDNWWAVITISSLDDALEAYKLSFPSSVDIDLPDELVSISTVWNSAGSNGSFASDASGRSAYVGDPDVSLSLSESANAECGGSIQPEIIPIIRTRKGRDIPSTAWFFYIKSEALSLSAADVLAKLTTLAGASVLQWPLFQPVQHTILLKGQRGSGRAQVSASGSVSTSYGTDQERNNKEVSSAQGVSYDFSTTFGTVVLPPTIHGAITISNTTPPASTYTAACSVGWTSNFTAATVAGYSIALPVPAETGPGNLDPADSGTGTVSDTATVALSASVSPTSLSATTPAAIPVTGLYMVGSPRIEPYKARWFQCHAQVINATILAP
jgi:hypothetical protein